MSDSVKLKLSEFKAADNINLHYKGDSPCSSVIEDCIGIDIKKGELIPKIFVKNLVLNRPSQIKILVRDSIPQLTETQQKEYDLPIFEILKKKKSKEPKTEKEVIDKLIPEYNMATLTEKLARYIKKDGHKIGNDKFKNWTEKEFGEEKIDRRKTSDKIIVDILNLK